MNERPNKTITTIKGFSVLEKATENTDSLQKHLAINHIDSQEENTGYTLLHKAVESLNKSKNTKKIIETLIVHGASPYIKDKKGRRVIENKTFQNYVNEILETHKPDSSKKTYFVYLAGPEVFLTFNQQAGKFIKAQTLLFNTYYLQSAPYNIEGLYPFDSGYRPKNMDFQDGINIYKGDIDLMNRSQAILANMVKFRGPGMDGGTAFEMGYMTAQGKVIVGYYDERPYFDNYKSNRHYKKKVKEEIGELTKKPPYNLMYDKNNLLVEPFEMPDNLMMIVPTLTPEENLNIADSSWEALFCLKEKLDVL